MFRWNVSGEPNYIMKKTIAEFIAKQPQHRHVPAVAVAAQSTDDAHVAVAAQLINEVFLNVERESRDTEAENTFEWDEDRKHCGIMLSN